MWFSCNPTNEQKSCFLFPVWSPVSTCVWGINTQWSLRISAFHLQPSNSPQLEKLAARGASPVEDGGVLMCYLLCLMGSHKPLHLVSFLANYLCHYNCYTFYFFALLLLLCQKPCSHHALSSLEDELCHGQEEVQWSSDAAWWVPRTSRPSWTPNSSDG